MVVSGGVWIMSGGVWSLSGGVWSMSGGVNEYRLICPDLMIWADIFSEVCNRCTDALMLLMLLLLIKCKLVSSTSQWDSLIIWVSHSCTTSSSCSSDTCDTTKRLRGKGSCYCLWSPKGLMLCVSVYVRVTVRLLAHQLLSGRVATLIYAAQQ